MGSAPRVQELLVSERLSSFSPPNRITHLTVANNRLVLGFATHFVTCVDMSKSEGGMENVEFSSNPADRLHRMELDSTGNHLLLSLFSRNTIYIHWNTKKVTMISKLTGHLVHSIAWNPISLTDSTTGPTLLGTRDGVVLELTVKTEDHRLSVFHRSSEDKKPQFSVHIVIERFPDCSEAISGISIGEIPSKSSHIFILLSTATKLYQFNGKVALSGDSPVFGPLFNEAFQPRGGPGYKHHPISDRLHGKDFFPVQRLLLHNHTYYFAWLSGLGIFCGPLDFQQPNNFVTQCQCFDSVFDEGPPSSLQMLPYHYVVSRPDAIIASSQLNGTKICVVPVSSDDQSSGYLGLSHDARSNTLWAFTDGSVYRIRVGDEDRFVWKIYLEQEDFDAALSHCSTDAEKAQVNSVRADKYFAAGQYYESAHLYAKSNLPFEQCALKFMDLSDLEGIKVLLKSKLKVGASESASALLIVWLVDLFLKQLGQYRDAKIFNQSEYNKMKAEFERFISNEKFTPILHTIKPVLYELMRSHNDTDNMLLMATVLRDNEKIVEFYFDREDYRGALAEIARQGHVIGPSLHYKYSEILIKKLPVETIDAWIELGRRMDCRKLLPALLAANNKHSLRYLENVVKHQTVPYLSINNLLISLLAEHDGDKLIKFLSKFSNSDSSSSLPFDPKFALRVCLDHQLKKPSVDLYTLLGHYEEAVQLALTFDIELAKSIAEKPIDMEEKRALWLCIARHVVEQEQDVEHAMKFLDKCSHLNIEDILPFFPEFVTIDSFKSAICRSLDQYKEHMEELRKSMDKCTTYSEKLRERAGIRRFECSSIKNSERTCYECGGPALSAPFFLFPCQHLLHQACLNASMYSEDDCPFCGDLAIESIDKPL